MQVTPVNLKIYTGLGVVAKKKNPQQNQPTKQANNNKKPYASQPHLSYPSLEVS